LTGLVQQIDRYDTEYHPVCSAVIGVLVHNEAATIETCLRAILAEQSGAAKVRSVVVIASGCTDQSEEMVRTIAAEDPRVRLVVESERSGKASAINLLLRETSDPIVVTLGGDVVFTRGSLIKLLEPFRDPSIGMTGVRPIPTNTRKNLAGRAVHILWALHHEVSLQRPKLGEAVAFRRTTQAIDRTTLVDEATMENEIRSRGMRLLYVPDAIVRNHGPETVSEYLQQRSRISKGHLALAAATGYRVSSMNVSASMRAAWRLWRAGEEPVSILSTIALEAIARTGARLSRLTRQQDENGVWRPIPTSKHVLGNGHVLREHHDTRRTLYLIHNEPTLARVRYARPTLAAVRQLVRHEDRLRVERRNLTITFRGDVAGARALRARLNDHFPDTSIRLAGSTENFQMRSASSSDAIDSLT
jgi:hypothetical protein